MAGKQGGGIMATLSKLDTLPGIIKDELIEKILIGESYQHVAEWLTKQNAVSINKRGLERFGKATRDKFGVLVKLGMPINEIVKHRLQIEALGVERVAQQLLDKLAEKNGHMFAYLDEKEAGQ
jgi:hypothetical protein